MIVTTETRVFFRLPGDDGKRKPSVPLAAATQTFTHPHTGQVVLAYHHLSRHSLGGGGSPDRQKAKTLCDLGASVVNTQNLSIFGAERKTKPAPQKKQKVLMNLQPGIIGVKIGQIIGNLLAVLV